MQREKTTARATENTEAPNAPEVTILMATNRVDSQFKAALQSCLSQDFSSLEVIVVGNGLNSSDRLRLMEEAKADERVIVFTTQTRYLTFSLNLGLHFAKGRYIARMDADDVAYNHRITSQYSFLEENPDISLCGSACDLINESNEPVGEWHYPIDNAAIRRHLKWTNPICHPTVMIRREILQDAGGYLGLFCEDYSTWVLLSENPKIKFANLTEKLIGYRVNNIGHQRNLTWRKAKSGVAGTTLRAFCLSMNPLWLLGTVLNTTKALILQSRNGK